MGNVDMCNHTGIVELILIVIGLNGVVLDGNVWICVRIPDVKLIRDAGEEYAMIIDIGMEVE